MTFRVHPEAWRFVLLAVILFWGGALVIEGAASVVLFISGAVVSLAVVCFFRDPNRLVPLLPDCAVAPADGVVCALDDVAPPQEALCDKPDVARRRIGIFMSVLDVHINRSPCKGVVRHIAYRRGRFINASFDKADEHNERQAWTIEDPHQQQWIVVQIAGLIARRIVGRLVENDPVERGERIGLIRFGSRVDVYMPQGWTSEVSMGQKVIGGETIVARRDDDAPDHNNDAE